MLQAPKPADDLALSGADFKGLDDSLVFMVAMIATASVLASMEMKRATYCHSQPDDFKSRT